MNFNFLQAAWFFFLIIPLLIFYFLKLRRNRKEISSLLLWQQVIEDSRVNSPFQRFKKNILLLLQLLLLCLLVFGAMDPFILGTSQGKKLPILIDCSASMGAVDEKGRTRLDLAKEKIIQLIEDKKDDQEISIVSFSRIAQRKCSFTANRRVLLNTVKSLKVDDVEGNIEDALKITRGMTKSSQFGEVLLYTDGNITDVPTFDLPFTLSYHQVGQNNLANAGITRFSAQRVGTANWMVFIQLNNTPNYQGTAQLDILQDGAKIGSERVVLGDVKQRLSFSVDGSKPSLIEARLTPSGTDALEADNYAYMNLRLLRPLNVYISPQLQAVKKIISHISGVNIVDNTQAAIDLVITDQSEDLEITCTNLLTFGITPPDLEPFYEVIAEQSQVVDWERSNLILQHASLENILLMKTFSLREGIRPLEIEKKSYEIIGHGEKAPIILKKDFGDSNHYHVLFHYDDSTLPFKVSFPILLTNLINKTLADCGLSERIGNKTGILPEMTLKPKTNYNLIPPNGQQLTVLSNEKGTINGVTAYKSGNYRFELAGETTHSIGVSLLSPNETKLTRLDTVKFNEVDVEAAQADAVTDKPLWSWIAGIAFALLLFEWWYFQKKPGRVRAS